MSFQSFMNQRKPFFTVHYPFLTGEQITAKLKDEWKKMELSSKRKAKLVDPHACKKSTKTSSMQQTRKTSLENQLSFSEEKFQESPLWKFDGDAIYNHENNDDRNSILKTPRSRLCRLGSDTPGSEVRFSQHPGTVQLRNKKREDLTAIEPLILNSRNTPDGKSKRQNSIQESFSLQRTALSPNKRKKQDVFDFDETDGVYTSSRPTSLYSSFNSKVWNDNDQIDYNENALQMKSTLLVHHNTPSVDEVCGRGLRRSSKMREKSITKTLMKTFPTVVEIHSAETTSIKHKIESVYHQSLCSVGEQQQQPRRRSKRLQGMIAEDKLKLDKKECCLQTPGKKVTLNRRQQLPSSDSKGRTEVNSTKLLRYENNRNTKLKNVENFLSRTEQMHSLNDNDFVDRDTVKWENKRINSFENHNPSCDDIDDNSSIYSDDENAALIIRRDVEDKSMREDENVKNTVSVDEIMLKGDVFYKRTASISTDDKHSGLNNEKKSVRGDFMGSEKNESITTISKGCKTRKRRATAHSGTKCETARYSTERRTRSCTRNKQPPAISVISSKTNSKRGKRVVQAKSTKDFKAETSTTKATFSKINRRDDTVTNSKSYKRVPFEWDEEESSTNEEEVIGHDGMKECENSIKTENKNIEFEKPYNNSYKTLNDKNRFDESCSSDGLSSGDEGEHNVDLFTSKMSCQMDEVLKGALRRLQSMHYPSDFIPTVCRNPQHDEDLMQDRVCSSRDEETKERYCSMENNTGSHSHSDNLDRQGDGISRGRDDDDDDDDGDDKVGVETEDDSRIWFRGGNKVSIYNRVMSKFSPQLQQLPIVPGRDTFSLTGLFEDVRTPVQSGSDTLGMVRRMFPSSDVPSCNNFGNLFDDEDNIFV